MKSEEAAPNISGLFLASQIFNEVDVLKGSFDTYEEWMVSLSTENYSLDTGQNDTNKSDPGVGFWWTQHGEEMLRHSKPITIVLIIAYALILLVGVVGNSLVVCVVLKSPRMRTVTNIFILNLAVSDLLVVIFCLPPTLLSNILVPWVLGWWMCKTVPYVQGVSVCASVYSLVAVSLDRCSAILFPLGGGFTKRKTRVIILIIWFIACTLASPWALYFEILVPDPEHHPNFKFCLEMWPEEMDGALYFLVGNLLLCYLIPLCMISICYILIWVRVSYRQVPTDSAAAMQKVHRKAKIGVLKMLVVVVLVFLLSWLPLYALFTRVKLGSPLEPWEETAVEIVMPIAQILGSSNSCVNPILYAFLNVKFRRAFQSLLPKCFQSKQTSLVSTTKSSLLQKPTTSVYNMTTGV